MKPRFLLYESSGPHHTEFLVIEEDGTEDGRTVACLRGVQAEQDATKIVVLFNALPIGFGALLLARKEDPEAFAIKVHELQGSVPITADVPDDGCEVCSWLDCECPVEGS